MKTIEERLQSIGAIITYQMAKKKMPLMDMQLDTGIDQRTISLDRRGQRAFKLERLIAYMDALGFPENTLENALIEACKEE